MVRWPPSLCWFMPFRGGGNERGGEGETLPLVSASCLYYLSKWSKIWLWTSTFDWLLKFTTPTRSNSAPFSLAELRTVGWQEGNGFQGASVQTEEANKWASRSRSIKFYPGSQGHGPLLLITDLLNSWHSIVFSIYIKTEQQIGGITKSWWKLFILLLSPVTEVPHIYLLWPSLEE